MGASKHMYTQTLARTNDRGLWVSGADGAQLGVDCRQSEEKCTSSFLATFIYCFYPLLLLLLFAPQRLHFPLLSPLSFFLCCSLEGRNERIDNISAVLTPLPSI